jgi:hypothetical protein
MNEQQERPERPIIFTAQGLGGLLLKQVCNLVCAGSYADISDFVGRKTTWQ